ncbi:hypothetical protein N9Z54_07550 [Planctomycetota bacterium]|nr:hypothetical protein [Planctomycetota bacterium]
MDLPPGGGAGGAQPLIAEPRLDEPVDRVVGAFHLREGRVLHGLEAPPVHPALEPCFPGEQPFDLVGSGGLVPRVEGAGEDPRLKILENPIVELRPSLGHLETLELVPHHLKEHALLGGAGTHDRAEEGLLEHRVPVVEADATLGLARATVAPVAVLDEHWSDAALEELDLVCPGLPSDRCASQGRDRGRCRED